MHADGGVGSMVLNSGRTCAPHVAEENESSAKARGIVCACMHACWLDRAAGWLKTGRRGAVLARAELSRKGERGALLPLRGWGTGRRQRGWGWSIMRKSA